MKRRTVVLITIGDPCGSGPELAVQAASHPKVFDRCRPVLIGSCDILKDALRRLGNSSRIAVVESLERHDWPPEDVPGTLNLIPVGNLSPEEYEKGTPSRLAGLHTIQVTRAATELALSGSVDALCTAPSSKVSLHQAGLPYQGLTGFFQEFTGAQGVHSMLVHEEIRVALATSHIPLGAVPEHLNKDRIVSLIQALAKGLEEFFGLAEPRIGVAGLNPHNGEGGLYGTEELAVLTPAIAEARQSGWWVHGPIPPDFVFPKIDTGEIDGAVMMYHDQAHIPLKALALYRPQTLLLGLPIIRTSVAHGTVMGKAKTGTADPSGMIEACCLAADVVRRSRKVREYGKKPH